MVQLCGLAGLSRMIFCLMKLLVQTLNTFTTTGAFTYVNTVKRRFKRRRYKRKVDLREFFWATDNFQKIKSQYERKSIYKRLDLI